MPLVLQCHTGVSNILQASSPACREQLQVKVQRGPAISVAGILSRYSAKMASLTVVCRNCLTSTSIFHMKASHAAFKNLHYESLQMQMRTYPIAFVECS